MWPPENSTHVVTFLVLGEAKPAGSKEAQVIYRTLPDGTRKPLTKDGRVLTRQQDMSGAAGKSWRGDIRDAVISELGTVEELLDGPLVIEARFYVERAQGHYRADGSLKANAPRYPHKAKLADGTKLLRAVEDALNKVLIFDDRRLCRGLWSRDYGRPRAEITLWRLPLTVGEGSAFIEGEPVEQLALAP